MSYETVLITGGSGFIGSHVARNLSHIAKKVVIFDRHCNNLVDNVVVEKGNAEDFDSLVSCVRKYDVSWIVHLAGPLIMETEQSPGVCLQAMIRMMINCLRVCHVQGIRMVWASSIAVFSKNTRPISDRTRRRPDLFYGLGKKICEDIAAHFVKDRYVQCWGFRLPVVYGRGRRDGATAFISRLIDQRPEDAPVLVPRLKTKMCYQYVIDSARILCLPIAERRFPSEPSINTPGHVATVEELLHIVQDLKGFLKYEVSADFVKLPYAIDSECFRTTYPDFRALDLREGIHYALGTVVARYS